MTPPRPIPRFPIFDVGKRIDELFSDLIHKPWGGNPNQVGWLPAVDLFESDSMYEIVADLPGVFPGDIEVSYDHPILEIRGHRSGVRLAHTAHCVKLERAEGEFVRRFQLSSPVDISQLKTEYENGIFRATIPKRPPNSP